MNDITLSRPRRGSSKHAAEDSSAQGAFVRIERIGKVTIYKRGRTYSLYYREGGRTVRPPIDGNLTVARATASKVNAALLEKRPSPLTFHKCSAKELSARFLDSITHVQRLALRTQDRYRAALTRFVEFCEQVGLASIDQVGDRELEQFVKWLRQQTRARNGARAGKQAPYKLGGIKFILSTCRTAFSWAARQRLLPPFAENPFMKFGIDRLRSPSEESTGPQIFTPEQEKAFFDACNPWQHAIFSTLATYGLRVGELTHLLIEDVDLEAGSFFIRSKPEMFWNVKTRRIRCLPLTVESRLLFQRLIGKRRAGFVFLEADFASASRSAITAYTTDKALRAYLQKMAAELRAGDTPRSEKEIFRAVTKYCRSLGQISEKRVRDEFMNLTEAIGCPEFTRVHDLRHLFSSRAQELGMNPLLVQELLGHASLDMTRRYTHLGLETKRMALQKMINSTEGGKGDTE